MQNYLYLEVADKLQDEIRRKVYGIHQKLPSENDLADQYRTSRLTIRKAIDALEKRQVVVKDRNRGTYVLAANKKISSGANGLAGFTEVAKKMNLNPQTKVLSLTEVTDYPQVVANDLRLNKDDEIWKIERLRYVNDEPMTHEQIYLKEQLLPMLDEKQAEGSLYELIEQNISIAYASQELEAVQLDKKTSRLLETKESSPAFLAHTVAYSVDGYPILYDDSYYRSDKYTFHNILYRNH
ncbi:GntR family transcriptional regulator, LSA1692 subfamily [Companilactobacillus hulinensis]|uniref:GntR family transcriptional regulator, LSA1692 subfamily n=1 Tax=Companilactobacillus hulinensis TaxID=2486007 RepID=UPI000F7957B3|nr:GntR family transcriptional regulator, LSA1692 subfamily [Companilactobacillus hulinensis]